MDCSLPGSSAQMWIYLFIITYENLNLLIVFSLLLKLRTEKSKHNFMCFSRTSHYHYLVILTGSVCQVILINVYLFVCLFICFKFSGVNLIIISYFPLQLAGEKTLSLPQWNSSLCDYFYFFVFICFSSVWGVLFKEALCIS